LDAGLSTRAANALSLEGITSWREVAGLTFKELLRIPGIGQATAEEIHGAARAKGKVSSGSKDKDFRVSVPAGGVGEEALVAALGEINPRLERFFQRQRLKGEDAEDCLQEALVATLTAYDRHEAGWKIEDLPSYLFGTVKRICFVRKRKAKWWREWLIEEERAMHEALRLVSDGRPEELEWLDVKRKMRGELSRGEVRFLKLQCLGLSVREMAQATGYAPESLRKIRSRLTRRLRMALGIDAERQPGSKRGKRYPQEVRQAILEEARAGRSPHELAKKHEPSEATIRIWMRKAGIVGPGTDAGRRANEGESKAPGRRG